MTKHLEDDVALTELMNGWMHRDQGEWDALRELFHEDGTIEISWFQGRAHDFVDASAGMAASRIRTKHFIGRPLITYSEDGTRALTETNAVIVGENPDLALGCSTHSRLLDRVEKRDGVWRISHRDVVYDFSHFDFPLGPVEIDRERAARFPIAYAALGYLLEASGYPVEQEFATQGGAAERRIKDAGLAWLQESSEGKERA